MLLLAGACGDAELELGPQAKPEALEHNPSAEAAAAVERFVDEPDWDGLLALLDRGHGDARELLGPHHLHVEADYDSHPAGLDPKALPPARVDEPINQAFSIHEVVDLLWASRADEGPRLHLDQRTGPDSGRELTIIDERSWTRIDNLGWYEAPLEGELWQLWLDDAQHAARDIAVLVGPVVDIAAVEPTSVDGRDALRVSLRPGEAHPERVAEALVPWRREASFELRKGELVLDRATGLWLEAHFEVLWRHEAPAHAGGTGKRFIEGSALLDATVEVLAEPPSLSPPPEAAPLPERERPMVLRDRLLNP